MQESSIFTKIINGEIPCHKIYEDDKTFAFLDIHPVQPGHVLVVPKVQVNTVWDLASDDYHAVMATVQKIGIHMRQVLPTPFISIKVVGIDIPNHAHVQLIPFSQGEDLYHHTDPDVEPDHEALALMAEKLHF